ncbi:MAG: PPC domain-containing protein, partial [Methylococcales bacterium]
MKCCSAFLLVFSSTPLYAQVPPEPLTNCTAEPTDQTITIGTVVECNIDVAGDQDLYRFAGTANSVVVVSLLNLTFGPSPVADLFAPGNATPFETLGAGTDSREVLLPATGTYTIRVAESG